MRPCTLPGIHAAAAAAVVAFAVGCGSSDSAPGNDKKPSAIQIVKANQTVYPNNILVVMSTPIAGQTIQGDTFTVELRTENFDIGVPSAGEQSQGQDPDLGLQQGLEFSVDGQHVLVTIDDTMQVAMTTGTATVGPLPPGKHTLSAFPRFSWYESVKRPLSFVHYTFYTGGKKGDGPADDKKSAAKKHAADTAVKTAAQDAPQPLLVYNAPTGIINGNKAERVLLDFFVANAQMGPKNFRVICTIDGAVTDTLKDWCAYYIQGAKPGKHTVQLQLTGPDGQSYGIRQNQFTITPPSPKPKESGA